jgi:phytanoyl-CoA hydroxylase
MPEESIDQYEGKPPEWLFNSDRTVNKRVQTVDDISEEDLGFFQEHGYLVVEELLDDEEIRNGLDGLKGLLAGDAPNADIMYEGHKIDDRADVEHLPPEETLDYVRRFAWFVDDEDRLQTLAMKPSLLNKLQKMVDGEPELFQDMALIKPPGGREKPWHQDKAFFDVALDAPVVGVWIALEEASPENGCMHIIPDSHKDGPVVHFDRRDLQICDTDVQVNEDVMVPLQPGGALFFDGLIHHGTPVNKTDTLRRALQFHYTAADADWVEDGHEEFNSEGKDVYC